MQKHWKAVQWASIVALFAVIASFMYGWYYLTYGLLMAAGVYVGVYLISVAPFKGRHDANAGDQAGPPPVKS